MTIARAIARARTTDLDGSIRFCVEAPGMRLVEAVHDTARGTREFAVGNDQGHTLYFGQALPVAG